MSPYKQQAGKIILKPLSAFFCYMQERKLMSFCYRQSIATCTTPDQMIITKATLPLRECLKPLEECTRTNLLLFSKSNLLSVCTAFWKKISVCCIITPNTQVTREQPHTQLALLMNIKNHLPDLNNR